MSHLGVHDGLDGRFKLLRVVKVDSPHVRLADEVLCVGMLGEHLPGTNRRLLQPAAGLGSRSHPDPFPLRTPTLGPRLRFPDLALLLTSLEVGLPRKNSWLSELWGGLKRD